MGILYKGVRLLFGWCDELSQREGEVREVRGGMGRDGEEDGL